MTEAIGLLPFPRSLRLLGGEAPWGAGEPAHRADPGLAPGGYSITLGPAGAEGSASVPLVTVSAHPGDGGEGLRNARATLAQLRRLFPARVPSMRIDDAPAFAVRGVMLDVSRTRVPTMDQLRRTVDVLASLKFNHLQLYTEHTFAYAGHREAWEGHSPLTPDEVRAIDGYARHRGVELAANQNCFGHLAHWLRLPRYGHLAETHGDWVFDVWPRSGPFSLCPTDPASLEFVRDLLAQLTACVGSPLVNIGADETYDVGTGRSKAEGDRVGRRALYTRFVSEVCGVVRSLGKRPMFWADIALSHPASLGELPADLIALAWGYEPSSDFDRWCGALEAAGRDRAHIWVCPGTSSWRSITGRTAERWGNLAAAAGCAGRADGLLACDWGDTGHHQTWPIALHALGHAAQSAWNPGARFEAEAAGVHLFGCAAVGPWLEALGDADAPLRAVAGRLSRPNQPGQFPLLNQSALFADLHNCTGGWTDRADVGALSLWHEARDRLRDARAALAALPGGDGLERLVRAELEHTLDVADLAADRAVARREGTTPAPTDGGLMPPLLAERLAAIMAEHGRLWAERSRPGGLEQSLGFYRKLMATV